MSDGAFVDWLRSDSWGSYRRLRQLRMVEDQVTALGSSLSHQRAESNRLRSQLTTLQGSVEQRLTRLTTAFEAFVELSDIRAVLGLFDAPALIRHRARDLLTSLGEPNDTPAAPELPPSDDVAGYWLAPAVRSAAALLRDGDPGADLGTAQALDGRRTAVLIAALTAMAGRRDLAAAWLPRALGDLLPGVAVPRWQRLLWQEAGHGTFGDAGRDALDAALRACRGRMTSDQRDALTVAVRERIDRPAGDVRRIPLFDRDPDVAAAVRAARQLSELRSLCEPPRPPASDARTGPAALGALVRGLVDEGTEEEKPLLRRAEELRATVENRRPESVVDWDRPLGPPEDLLVADAFDATAGRGGDLARGALADLLVARAGELAAAAAVDMPFEVTVDLERRGTARVTANGADRRAVEAAGAAAERMYPPVAVPDARTLALAAAGVAVPVLAAFGGAAFALLGAPIGAGLLIGAATRFVASRRERAGHEAARQQARRAVDDAAARAVAGFAAAGRALAEIASDADADRDAVQASMTGRALAEPAAG